MSPDGQLLAEHSRTRGEGKGLPGLRTDRLPNLEAATEGPVDLRSAANARSAAEGRESDAPPTKKPAVRLALRDWSGRGDLKPTVT